MGGEDSLQVAKVNLNISGRYMIFPLILVTVSVASASYPGFAKVFSHDTKGGLFTSKEDAGSKNTDNPEALLFSKLNQLEHYRGSDGNFQFKLCYPEVTTGVDGKKCNDWIQSSNPFTDSSITGFRPIFLAFTKTGLGGSWEGIGKNPQNLLSLAIIGDTPSRSSWWWTAIGAQRYYGGHGNFPGPNPTNVKKVELYVKDSKASVCSCDSDDLTWMLKQEIRVKKNNLIGIIPSWGPSFKISFELKVLSFASCRARGDGVSNYLTFTATDKECCDIGDRVPAFFTNSGGFLQLATQINDNGNVIKSSPQLEENVWYKLEVEQVFHNHQYFFLLRANGREIFKEVQHKPRQYENVKIYASKSSPANVIIRNLSYQS